MTDQLSPRRPRALRPRRRKRAVGRAGTGAGGGSASDRGVVAGAGVAQAELRQGAVPRPLPARPDPPAPDVRRRRTSGAGEAFLARLRRLLRDARSTAPRSSARRGSPTRSSRASTELGAFGMKIPTRVRRARAVAGRTTTGRCMLVGSAHPRSARCCPRTSRSACRSRSKLFGTEEQKQQFLPRCAARRRSARSCSPSPTSAPTRPGCAPRRCRRRRRLRARRGEAVDDQRRRRRPARRDGPGADVARATAAASRRSSSRPTRPGITVENRNAFMGLRGIENGVTRFHQVRVPGREPASAARAQGLKIALTTLNTGRLSLPAMCVGAGKWCTEDRPRVVRPSGSSGAGRSAEHEAVADQDRVHRRDHLRAWRPCSTCPAQMADDERNDIRIEAALAKLYGSRDGLADRRRAGADPRRPRLRDRRVAGRPRRARRSRPSRCCATCGSTASSRARPRSCTC